MFPPPPPGMNSHERIPGGLRKPLAPRQRRGCWCFVPIKGLRVALVGVDIPSSLLHPTYEMQHTNHYYVPLPREKIVGADPVAPKNFEPPGPLGPGGFKNCQRGCSSPSKFPRPQSLQLGSIKPGLSTVRPIHIRGIPKVVEFARHLDL